MWFIWLAIGFIGGVLCGAAYSMFVKNTIKDLKAEIEKLKHRLDQ